jgi:fructan beta-fructosidase
MNFTVDKKYLLMPVSNDELAEKVVIKISCEGRQVREFDVALPVDGQAPDWWAFYPAYQFAGKELKLEVAKGTGSLQSALDSISLSDEIPGADDDYALPYRNQFHFSTRHGWSNDPNGLVFDGEKYHMYYQYNPFGVKWGNMHWGHAVSDDLVNWHELDISMFQNGLKDMMFSGGGFMDHNNTAGYGNNTLFAAFTSTGRGECLAYSQDGGDTFTEIPENPVVKHNGRDPKVIWHEPTGKWIMMLYDVSPEELDVPPLDGTTENWVNNSMAFYSSADLHEWKLESRFTVPDRGVVYECPEIFELPVEDEPGETKWIIYGAQNRYLLGTFDGKKFTADSDIALPGEDGTIYASQTFSDLPGRRVQIGWARGGMYLEQFPNLRSSQAMSVAKEITLHRTVDGLRLFFNPVQELDKLHGEVLFDREDMTVADTVAALERFADKLLDITLEYVDAIAAFELDYCSCRVTVPAGHGNIRILADTTIIEFIINDGRSSTLQFKSGGALDSRSCRITSHDGLVITSLKITEMKSIW